MLRLFIQRFGILSCALMLGAAVCPGAGESSLADWVERFCGQITKNLSAKSPRGVIILSPFENAGKQPAEFFNEVLQSVKATLQKNGLEVYEAASEDEMRNIVEKIRADDPALVQGVLSETLTRLILSARISYPRRSGAPATALATLEKKPRARALARPAGSVRNVTLQEVYRSAAWPQKILDAAIAELNPAQPLFLLLTETTLLGYRFENGNLIEDLKLAVPVASEGPASRDPRGMLAFYRFQSRDHVLVATHRTGGTYLLRADGGAWSFLRLSSEWLFKSRYAPTPSLVLSAHLVPGKNYFSGDVGLLDFARFAAVLEERIRAGSEDLSDALTRQSPSALRGKISNFYNVAFADQGSRGSPLIVAGGLDGRLRLYDATLHEVRVLRDPLVGTTFATYFDPERDRLYLFATAPSLPDTSDSLAVLELKDRELKSLVKTNNYPGSVSALGLGYLTGREGLHVATVLETNGDFETESVLYLFNLRE